MNRLNDFLRIHFMDFDTATDFLQQRDGQLAAEMLAKFFEAGKNLQIPPVASFSSSGREQFEAELFEQFQNTFAGFLIQQTGVARINHVERDADGDGLAVADLEMGKLLQLVRRPMPEIQRACRTSFKRVAAVADVFQMQFGATAD